MRRTNISSQMKTKSSKKVKMKREKEYEGSGKMVISTGSTLLDLAISGGRFKYGGIPAGILVEAFGPSSAGKTVFLSEVAGAVKRKGGEVMFHDPEARLDKQFAQIFDLDVDQIVYEKPDNVPEVFEPVRSWKPKNTNIVNGIFGDSMAALSTEMEAEGTDKYGMRRAKEFSEELRKTCRVIKNNNYLMVVSNQVRVNVNAQAFQEKYSTPGGMGLPFYSSLRLKFSSPQKITKKIKIKGKEYKRIIGVRTMIDVYKSSIWKPYHQAPVTIVFDYGIDDIRENLQFVKEVTKEKTYKVFDNNLGISMDKAIQQVEEKNWENKLKRQVVKLWNEIESKFEEERKPKKR